MYASGVGDAFYNDLITQADNAMLTATNLKVSDSEIRVLIRLPFVDHIFVVVEFEIGARHESLISSTERRDRQRTGAHTGQHVSTGKGHARNGQKTGGPFCF
jgi:hypothetical protein